MFLYDMPEKDYHKHDSVSASFLSMFETNPALAMWSKTAPRDPKKSTTSDFGSAFHLQMLEPHLFDDKVIVSSLKSRTAKGFVQMQIDNPDKYALTEDEADLIRFMAQSSKANPLVLKVLESGKPEVSIFTNCPVTGLELRIRVDWLVTAGDTVFPCNLKSTADLSDWRNPAQWKNPLFAHNYGFSAAFYMYVLKCLDLKVNEHPFICCQKSAMLGSYPASVFTVTYQELENLGFVERVKIALAHLAECKKDNSLFLEPERFCDFGVDENMIIDCSELDGYMGV